MSRRKSPRRLKPDELELWRQVQKTAEPLHPHKTEDIESPAPAPVSQSRKLRTDLQDFRIGRTAPQTRAIHDLQDPIGQRIARQPVAMDARKFIKMKRGKLGIEARIDLHGRTLDQAHSDLTRFIHSAYSSDYRLVLVITGKGRDRDVDGPMPVRRGLLKHQVPHWLTSGTLRSLVLQISEAHQSHGGSGAYYVYLRRRR